MLNVITHMCNSCTDNESFVCVCMTTHKDVFVFVLYNYGRVVSVQEPVFVK